MADAPVDPRYAAQFQRGYDPTVHPAAAVQPAVSRDLPLRLPGGPPNSAPRVVDRPRPVTPPVPAPAVPTPGPVEPGVAESGDQRPRLTEWALLIAAVVLLVAAVGLFWQASTDILKYAGADPAELAWSEVRNTLPGPLLAGAVLAGSAWLTLRALIGRER